MWPGLVALTDDIKGLGLLDSEPFVSRRKQCGLVDAGSFSRGRSLNHGQRVARPEICW